MDSTKLILLGLFLAILLFPRFREICKAIAERLAPRVVIDVALDNFVFSRKDSSVQIRPYLYFLNDHIITVGEDPIHECPDAVKVNLFEYELHSESVDRGLALWGFLFYGIAMVMKPLPLLIKPVVILRGVGAVSPLLCGYERHVFNSVLADRAIKVLYE